MSNPIRSSDLYQDDGAILEAIDQLRALGKTHDELAKEIQTQAVKVRVSVEKTVGVGNVQKEQLTASAREAEKLAKAYDQYNASQEETAAELARLKELQKNRNSEMRLEAKLAQSAAGSYNALSAQYGLLKLKLNAMSEEERKSTDAGKKMEAQAKDIYEEMKRLQEATGKTALNVGNYKESVKEALAESAYFANQIPGFSTVMGLYGKAVNAGAKAKLAFKAATNGAIKPLQLFKLALASTGIGAIVVALGTLIAAFLSTQRGIDEVNKVLVPLKTIFQGLIGLAQEVATKVFDRISNAVKNPREAIKALGDSIKAFLLDRLEGFAKFGKGFVKILQGEFKEGFKELGDAAGQVTGLNNFTNAVNDASKALTGNVKANWELGKSIQATRVALREEEIAWQAHRAALERDLAASRELAADVNKNSAERIKALKAAQGLNDQIAAGEESLAKKRLNLAQLEAQANDTDAEARLEIARLEAELINVQRDNLNRKRELVSVEAGIRKQDATAAATAAKAKADAEAKSNAERLAAEAEFNATRQQMIDERATTEDEKQAVELRKLDEFYAKQLEKLQKYGLESTQLEGLIADEKNAINARYAKEAEARDKEANEKKKTAMEAEKAAELEKFDLLVAYERSKLELAGATATEIARFELETERDRLAKQLELNEKYREALLGLDAKYQGNLSDVEINTTENRIALIDQKIAKANEGGKSIYERLGLTVTPEQEQAVQQSLQTATQAVTAYFAKRTELAGQRVTESQQAVTAAQAELNAEIEKAQLGYAVNIGAKEKELQRTKQLQATALAEQRRAQRTQQAIQAVEQASNLITASSKIWATLGFPAAVPALAIMWGSFLATQVQAFSATKKQYGQGGFEWFNYGGSHQSGNDIPLGVTSTGKQRTVERGEAMAIFSRKATRQYGAFLPELVAAINTGTFEQHFVGLNDGTTVHLNTTALNLDTSRMEWELTAIRKQSERRVSSDRAGNRVEQYRNKTRTYV